jgi:hypothetical protein
MRQITSFIVALLVCIALWMMLAIQLTDFIVYDLPVRPQTRWQVLMQIWSDAPLLLVSVAAGMVIFRTQPLLFGITCALAAAASVVLCTSGPILMKPVFVVKWALFFGFAIAGSYLGWWILRLRNCQDTVLKVWQSLATLVVIFGIMALWQWWHTNRFMRRLFEPLVEAVQIEHSSEQHGGQISSEGAPSAPPNESSPWSFDIRRKLQ